MKFSINKQPSIVLLEIAQKHKKMRKNKHLSQVELANRSGVSLGSLKRFETTGHINFESLLKLAHFFNRLNDFDLVFQEDNYKEIEKLFSK